MAAIRDKVVMYGLSIDDFSLLLQGKIKAINFPSDGRVLGVRAFYQHMTIGVLVGSDQHESLDVGSEIPSEALRFETKD